MVIQVYAPICNAEEAEVEQVYEDLQDLLELTPPKMSFSLGMVLIPVPCTVSWTSVHSSSDALSDLVL